VVDEQRAVVRDTTWRGPTLPASPTPPAQRPPTQRRRRRLGAVLPAVLALAIAVAASAVAIRNQRPGAGLFGGADTRADRPTPGHEESGRPLGRPPAAPRSTSYAFMLTQPHGSAPVAYDPCRPIHYVVRPAGAPTNGQALIRAAVARVSSGTALRFVDDGTTDEAPSRGREVYQPDRYGDRWAPVLVAWQSAGENADFAADVTGEAGSVPISQRGTPQVYVTGQVMLDAGKIGHLLERAETRAVALGVVLHEFGHLVGLGHVSDRRQLMYPQAGLAVTGFAAGDRAGLAKLGAGPCAPWA
jgi:hypothetical protein